MANILRRFRLDGQIAVVTGAGGGIGRAAIGAFREAGATVVGLDRSVDGLAEVVESSAHAISVDVRDPSAISTAFETIRAAFGPVDVLVNNAGVASVGRTVEVAPEEWDRVLEINLRGAVLCAQAAARQMAGRGGSIVNVASQLGITPAAERAAYVSSKAGLLGLTKALALEWVGEGIRVNAVAPGTTSTPMIRYLEENQEAGDAFRRRIPMGRFGHVDEIAAACLFLAAPASSYVTGHVLVADGGYSVW
jgi:NAD(P)-dependent dehydrogenase (short-subunit alcohol dehydrogenase family)